MTPMLPVSSVLFALVLLSGCGETSTELPVDGRDIIGVQNTTPGVYAGRVMDDYLVNARVWLDLNGDNRYNAGPVTVEVEPGTEVTVVDGEPTALTGAGGRFQLDTSSLIRNPDESPDIDPRHYALIAVVVPNLTEEETRAGNVVQTRAYMMSAPPGVQNVSPLSTLLRNRILLGGTLGDTGSSLSIPGLENISPGADYVMAGDTRAQAYARALARFKASQFPDTAGEQLVDGTETVLDGPSLNLLRLSYVQNAAQIIGLVDEAAAGGSYSNVDVDALALPSVPLDLADPFVLRTQRVQAYEENGNGLPAAREGVLTDSARLTFSYSAAGQLAAISANGCMEPSMQEMVRLANAGGRISETGTEGLPGVSVSQDSYTYYREAGDDERLTFDWSAKTAAFDTRTTCHAGLATSSALGGEPEKTYHWTLKNGKVETITDGEVTLTPDYNNATGPVFGYTLTRNDNGAVLETVSVDGSISSCEGAIRPEDVDVARVISGQQAYTFTGYEPQPTGFPGLSYDWDIRDGEQHLLRQAFLDPGVDQEGQGLQWEYAYAVPIAIAQSDQHNLISEARLSRYGLERTCGRAVSSLAANNLYAIVGYDYSRLSDYLADQIQ